MKIFALSDIHGMPDAFEDALSRVDISHDNDNKLVLLGDYIHRGYDDFGVIRRIIALQQEFGSDRIIALLGTHEALVIHGLAGLTRPTDGDPFDYDREEDEFIAWMCNLPLFYEVEDLCIFVHAGIEEDAGEYWQWCTPDSYYTGKYPPTLGKFYTNIVAGHIGTYIFRDDMRDHSIFYDNASHYYIDGIVYLTGYIPVLMVDTDTTEFFEITDSGAWRIESYNAETEF